MKTNRAGLTRRIPWHALVALGLLGVLTLSVSARSDTYNFYFDPKKKPGEGGEEAKPEAPPPAPAAPTPQAQVVVPASPSAGQPIVINNNNNVQPVIQPPPAPAPAAPPPAPASAVIAQPSPDTESRLAELEATFRRPSESGWKMALTGMAFLQEFDFAYVSGGQLSSYRNLSESWGGLVTLGYDFSRSFGVNFYGGARVAPRADKTFYHAGLDLEITPFRLPVPFNGGHDLFELGLIIGGSTAMAARGNFASLHAGARININLTPEFGFTASGRGNLGYLLFEGGIVARL